MWESLWRQSQQSEEVKQDHVLNGGARMNTQTCWLALCPSDHGVISSRWCVSSCFYRKGIFQIHLFFISIFSYIFMFPLSCRTCRRVLAFSFFFSTVIVTTYSPIKHLCNRPSIKPWGQGHEIRPCLCSQSVHSWKGKTDMKTNKQTNKLTKKAHFYLRQLIVRL